MAVFETFAREQRELAKSELARMLDLPESSISDLLNTLYELGYVTRMARTRRFYPTGRLLGVATEIARNDVLAASSQEAVALVAERSGETAACGILSEDQVKIVAVAHGTHRLRYVLSVGDAYTVHGTALGKALLGGSKDAEMARVLRLKPLRRLTEHTIVDPVQLEREVVANRERGWYAAMDEGTIGVSSCAVSGWIGDQLVGLTVIGPTERIKANADSLRKIITSTRDDVFGSPTVSARPGPG
jgi:DNA-binding IclR family transcriptional regulator